MRSLTRWHRTLGLGSVALVVILAVTGVLLNHTERLRLDERHVAAEALLDWYGIAPPGPALSFPAGVHWVIQLGGFLYVDGREIRGEYPPLLGAVALADQVLVAVEGRLLVLTPTGDLIEVLGGEHGVPAGMRALGVRGSDVVVQGAHGSYVTDAQLRGWRERADVNAAWSQPAPAPAALLARVIELYRGQGLPLERVVRDLHSGQILGRFGFLLMDAAAIAFVLLGASGMWMWARRRQ